MNNENLYPHGEVELSPPVRWFAEQMELRIRMQGGYQVGGNVEEYIAQSMMELEETLNIMGLNEESGNKLLENPAIALTMAFGTAVILLRLADEAVRGNLEGN